MRRWLEILVGRRKKRKRSYPKIGTRVFVGRLHIETILYADLRNIGELLDRGKLVSYFIAVTILQIVAVLLTFHVAPIFYVVARQFDMPDAFDTWYGDVCLRQDRIWTPIVCDAAFEPFGGVTGVPVARNSCHCGFNGFETTGGI
jgi:hypothetical protein